MGFLVLGSETEDTKNEEGFQRVQSNMVRFLFWKLSYCVCSFIIEVDTMKSMELIQNG